MNFEGFDQRKPKIIYDFLEEEQRRSDGIFDEEEIIEKEEIVYES